MPHSKAIVEPNVRSVIFRKMFDPVCECTYHVVIEPRDVFKFSDGYSGKVKVVALRLADEGGNEHEVLAKGIYDSSTGKLARIASINEYIYVKRSAP